MVKAKLKKARQAAETIFIVALLRLGGLFPLEWASAFGGKVLELIAINTRRHPRAIANLRRIYPQMDTAEANKIARAHWNNMGRNIMELPHSKWILDDPGRVEISGQEIIDAYGQADKGAIIVGGHFGNWELVPGVTSHMKKRTEVFYHPLSNTWLDERLLKLRLGLLPNGGMISNTGNSLKKAMKVLGAGHFIGMMADLREDSGLDIPFMGQPAKTSQAAALMALRYDIPLIAIIVLRKPAACFKLEISEIEVSRTGDQKADIAETTKRLNDLFEDHINADPKQWLWSHRRW